MRETGRLPRGVVLYLVLLGTVVGLVVLTASWTPRWGVDVLAGTRVVLTPAESGASQDDLEASARELERRAREAGASGADARVRSDGVLQIALPGRVTPEVIDAVEANGEVGLRLVLAGSDPVSSAEVTDDGGAAADPEDADEADGQAGEPDPLEGEDGAGLPGGIAVEPPAEPEIPVCTVPADSLADPAAAGTACGPLGGTYTLGPVVVTGADVLDAQAVLVEGVWSLDLRLDTDAITALQAARTLAAESTTDGAAAAQDATESDERIDPEPDPGARLAVVVDDQVAMIAPAPSETAPTDTTETTETTAPSTADSTGTPSATGSPENPENPENSGGTSPGEADAGSDAGSDGAVDLVLAGDLDQPTTAAVAQQVRDGALPVVIADVEVVRLGSALDPDEGTRGAAVAVAVGIGALAAALALLRRRGIALFAHTAGAAGLSLGGLLLADQVVGLPIGLSVVVTALATWSVVPVLAAALLRAVDPATTPDLTVARSRARGTWRRWWPPVAALIVVGVALRALLGGEIGDVGTTIAVVGSAAIVSGRLLAVPLSVRGCRPTSPRASDPAAALVARSSAPDMGRRAAAVVVITLLGAALSGLLVQGIAADPALSSGEEHTVQVAGDPVEARASIRAAVSDAGVPASTVRASGDATVLWTTPPLDDAERQRMVAAVLATPQARATVGSVGIEAAGSARSWTLGAAIAAVGLLAAGALTVVGGGTRQARSSSVLPAVRSLGAALLCGAVGLGVAAWGGVTAAPATFAALGCVVGVAAVVLLSLAVLPIPAPATHRTRLGVALCAATAVLPPLAIALTATSVRAPFVVIAAGLACAFCMAVLPARRTLHGLTEAAGAGDARTDPAEPQRSTAVAL